MQLINAISLLSVAAAVSATSVSYDTGYDDGSRSMTAVSCSDGANGLTTRYGWQTQGAIPRFPFIGGSSDIAGWNSDQCGNCYSVSYNGNTINILAIDHAGDGLNIAQEAMDSLTGGQAVQLGRIDAVVTKTTVDQCGLTASKRSTVFRA